MHFDNCLSATQSAKYCKLQYGEGFALGCRTGFALDSHWIRIGKSFAETSAAMRWVRPVGLLYHDTDLGGPRAIMHVRLDLTDLARGWPHVGRHGGDGRRGAAGPVFGDSSDRLSKTIRLDNTK